MDHVIKSEVSEEQELLNMEPLRVPTTLIVNNSIANSSAAREYDTENNATQKRRSQNEIESKDSPAAKRVVKQEDWLFDENLAGSSSSDVPDLEQGYSYADFSFVNDTSRNAAAPSACGPPVQRRRRAKEKQTSHYLKEGIFTRAPNDHAKYGAWYDKLIENGIYKKRWICKLCNVVYNPTCPLNCRNHIQNAHPELLQVDCSEEELCTSMIDCILQDGLTISAVQGTAFKQFVKTLIKYAICRSKNGDTKIDSKVVLNNEELKQNIERRLEEAEKSILSHTLEQSKSHGCGFSADFSRDFNNFFSLTAQYIDAEWTLKNFVISFQRYPVDEYSMSSKDINLFCTKLLMKNGFIRGKNKLFFTIAADPCGQQSIYDESDMPCMCDIGNTILKEITAVSESSNLSTQIKTKCRLVGKEIDVLQHFIMSIRRNETIREKFGNTLQTHALTRWLPGYKMVEGFLRNTEDLTAFINENSATLYEYQKVLQNDINKNCTDYLAYSEIGRMLQEFIQAFETNSTTPTANLIITKVAKLYLAFEEILSKKLDEVTVAQCLASAAKECLLAQLPKFNKKVLFISAFCDPCTRGQLEIVELFKREMQSIHENEDVPRQSIDFVDFPFDEKLLPVTEELHAYESYRLFPFLNKIGAGNYSPLLFWKEHADKFPLMAKLAIFYLAIPASVTSNERCFQQFGGFVSLLSDLPAEKISTMVTLKSLQNLEEKIV